tara:strand:+ start:1023 stop:1259 length:237 start_codon:yes stop_codon:yes gene_type:complete
MKKLFVLLIFASLGFTQLKKDSEIEEEFFKVYVDEVEYYRFKNNEGRYIELTNEALMELADDDVFWDSYMLKGIVFKD